MASAAAVGADAARSPLRNDIGEDGGHVGEITSGVYSKDESLPDLNGDVEDSDEDLPANPLRGHRPARPVNDDDAEEEGNDPLDLFGDDEDEPAGERQKPARRLDDEDLDSGDDQDRADRLADEPEEEYMTQEKLTMDLELPRQPIPEPSDGEMYLLKMPSFMSIDPRAWDTPSFQPPTTDHHSTKTPSATFSAYNTALTTLRWRHSPSNHTKLQSNARINRWSDGSLTLQLASDPTTHYEIDGNPLAPPQRNPIKPTPVSKHTPTTKAAGRAGASAAGIDDKYAQAKDAFTYLVRPHRETGSMLATHKVTAGLSIKQSSSIEDDAIERLQASLAAASKAHGGAHRGLVMELNEEDPEDAKRQALAAQKKIDAERRKVLAAADRESARAGRMGRSAGRFSGLNVGMLEDEEEGGGRHGPSPSKARGNKPRRRRNSEYSDDEDFGRRNFQNDEYDREDGFVADSDEEEVVEEDDEEDPDDGIVEDVRHHRRERTPKRARGDVEEDGEADAPGEVDEEGVLMARTKRRRVVDEGDEEEE